MNNYLVALVALVSSYTVYTFINSIIANRYHARRARELNCQPAYQRPHKLPIGLDLTWRVVKADKAQVVPTEFYDIYTEVGRPTWIQNFLGTMTFVTAEPKNIQAILATQFNDYSIGLLRRKNFFPMLGNGIFTSDGKSWEHSRALLRPQFARDQVADLELEENHVQDMFKHLSTTPSSTGNWTDSIDLVPLFFRLTLDSATEFLFGQSVDSQISALPENLAAKQLQTKTTKGLDWTSFAHCFDGATMALGVRGRLSEMYWMYSPKSFYDNCTQVHKFADYYVNLALNPSAKESHLEKGAGANKRAKYVFLTELVKATRDPIELRSQLLNILLAGRDTTAGLLGWTFYLLVRHPDQFARLRATVIDTFGSYDSPKDISFATLKSCSYLQHTLSEVLRLYATVPINSRRAVKDTTLPTGGGSDGKSPIYVRKGQEVNYSVHIMHRRKDIWGEDAEEFKPERWAGRKTGWEFLPFNGGPRICLGQQFALTEAGYVIVRMLQRFDALELTEADLDGVTRHQYSVTTAPAAVKVRLRAAK